MLERPSYYSLQQSMSGVFKRDAAREIMAREARLVPFMQADGVSPVLEFLGEPRKAARAAAPTLDEVCKSARCPLPGGTQRLRGEIPGRGARRRSFDLSRDEALPLRPAFHLSTQENLP